jgi:thiol-disulfide isomerase/thioredoxin
MTTMKHAAVAIAAVLLATAARPGPAFAQQGAPGRAAIEAINAEYERDLAKLERQRLERLGQLASGPDKAQADAAFDAYFQLAIAKGLFREAEPLAEKVIQGGAAPPRVAWLAHLVNTIAEADRGRYEESLESLATAVQARRAAGGDRAAGLPVAMRAALVDAYYQRLVQDNQVEVARKAMRLIADNAQAPPVRDLAARRLKQLDLVGRPAPPIAGPDVDGRPVKADDLKGDVVLVVFWATWCVPSGQEVPWLAKAYATYRDRGFRIVGVNVDTLQEEAPDPGAARPNVRRFLLDYNIPWPTLINGQGDQDFARAFGVSEIPSNVLIGRDGKVARLDVKGSQLEKAVAEALDRRP